MKKCWDKNKDIFKYIYQNKIKKCVQTSEQSMRFHYSKNLNGFQKISKRNFLRCLRII